MTAAMRSSSTTRANSRSAATWTSKAADRLQRRCSRRLPLEVRDGQRQLHSIGRLNERGRDLNVVWTDGGVQPGQRRQQPHDENGQERMFTGAMSRFRGSDR